MKKKFFLLLTVLICAHTAYASDVAIKNAGFIPANIWYSKEGFFAGETVRIYTAIFNGSTYDLSGNVEFLDNNIVLGTTPLDVLSSGQVREVSVPWEAVAGSHTITARITDTNMSVGNGPKTPITLENAEAGKSDIVVQVDPAIAAAQAQAQIASVAGAGAQVAGQVNNIVQTVDSGIPAPIKTGTAAGIGTVENLRTTLENQFRLEEENQAKQISVLNARSATTSAKIQKANQKAGILSTISGYTEKPFAYVAFVFLAFLQFIFHWQILFYGILLYVLYKLLKFGFRKIRGV